MKLIIETTAKSGKAEFKKLTLAYEQAIKDEAVVDGRLAVSFELEHKKEEKHES